MNNIIVLANGDFPVHSIPLNILYSADMIICCDGAFLSLKEIPADWIVTGDGDSLSEEQINVLGNRYIKDSDQETNDLTKAMRLAISSGAEDITILAATGKREDHALGNISLLAKYLVDFPQLDGKLRMVTDYGVFTPINGRRQFESFPRQQVSIISMTPDVPITVSGLQFPIDNRCLTQWWEGTLNAALSDSFVVEGGIIVVYQTHEAKI